MITVITLHKLNSGFANIAPTWSLDGTLIDEFSGDYSADYILPAGYKLGQDHFGTPAIYNSAGQHCPVSTHSISNPVPVLIDDSIIRLQRAN